MCRSYSLLHLYNPIQIPVREFKIEKDAERNKTELRNERSFLACEEKAIWSQRGLSSQNATAAALPTFRESTPWDMGIFTV